jgi:hypothetical protein
MSDKKTKVDLEFLGSREEQAETRTIASRKRLRSEMEDEIEKFLAKGGSIQQIEPNVQADPPTKPNTSYGSRPI